MKYCLGIDVGGTTVKMGIFQNDGSMVSKLDIILHRFPSSLQQSG